MDQTHKARINISSCQNTTLTKLEAIQITRSTYTILYYYRCIKMHQNTHLKHISHLSKPLFFLVGFLLKLFNLNDT